MRKIRSDKGKNKKKEKAELKRDIERILILK